MSLYILTETSAGYALLKSKDKKLLKRDDIGDRTSTASATAELFKLKNFAKFESAEDALDEVSNLVEAKITPKLTGLLENVKDEGKFTLAVADKELGRSITKTLPHLNISAVADSSTDDIFRAIRTHLHSLLPDLLPEDVAATNLGLSHSISRYKLKFSPDKMDIMVVQAIGLLDDLDKELNMYAMRVKEWYGWHFPEAAKIINDNLAYAKVIQKVGDRTNAANVDLSDILPEEIETAVKAAAEISMGSEIDEEDLLTIHGLAESVIDFTEYRKTLSSYLSARMNTIAPNLTALVGDLVGARLIQKAGSLINLAKNPGSTIQVLGAEKALFRALKTKHDTPKYGIIYHASLVGQASGKNKGKIARMLAAKTALGLRVDSLADWGVEGEGKAREPSAEEKSAVGMAGRAKIERRLRELEGKPLRGPAVAIAPSGQLAAQPGKWEVKEARKYNPDADGVSKDAPAAAGGGLIEEVNGAERNGSSESATVPPAGAPNGAAKSKKDKKDKRDKKRKRDSSSDSEEDAGRASHKAEKKAKKEAKKAAKAAKKAEKESKKDQGGDKRKRKHEDDEGEKKKKKKKKHDDSD